jgi:hypothetical protein
MVIKTGFSLRGEAFKWGSSASPPPAEVLQSVYSALLLEPFDASFRQRLAGEVVEGCLSRVAEPSGPRRASHFSLSGGVRCTASPVLWKEFSTRSTEAKRSRSAE